MILGKQVNACFFLAVHVVQKKINWANKEAIIVIADEQEKKRPYLSAYVTIFFHCFESKL
jgi:hypothetical protein